MPRWTAVPLRRLITALVTLLFLQAASAASLAVYPFSSQDPLLGVALADELAAAFHDSALVFGPEVAAGLVPPLVVIDGFINLGVVLEGDVWTGPSGAALLRSGTGVDVAVTGTVEQYDERTLLRLEVAHAEGTRSAQLSAVPGDRARLVAQAARLVAPLIAVDAAPNLVPSPDLGGGYGSYVRGVTLAASGLVTDAAAEVEAGIADWPARGQELYQDLKAVIDGPLLDEAGLTSPRRLARRAQLALSLPSLHEADAAAAFRQLAEAQGLPVANAWLGVLDADRGDLDAAAAAFQAADTAAYPYAGALLGSVEQARGEVEAARAQVDALVAQGPAAGPAPLLGASLVAYMLDDPARQVSSLKQLARAAPFLTYPQQELSFLAFDRDDALAAAEALTVAVQLRPDSSLYWTNLGWANYLLGFLEASEAASKRAMDLDGNQYIAAYNLGLVRTVTGRLEAALDAYDYAVALDPAIDDAAVEDLVNARGLYPGVSEVEYVLARLYEAKGQRSNARAAYRRFLSMASNSADYAAFAATARERLLVLSAPPPPLEILGQPSVRLGQRGPDAQPFRPGDPLYATFELSTPGEQLPGQVQVTLTLRAAGQQQGEALASAEATIEPPAGAVGYVVDSPLELPTDLPEGNYELAVLATASDGLEASASVQIQVAGPASPLRQLFGRNVVMTGLEIEAPLFTAADLQDPARVVQRMVQELHDSQAAADAALPQVEGGRFDGLSGAQLFQAATEQDVRDFLAYVASTGSQDSRFAFVDGYAQWALDGGPAAQ